MGGWSFAPMGSDDAHAGAVFTALAQCYAKGYGREYEKSAHSGSAK